MTTTEKTWLSVYIYYQDSVDKLLIQVVDPLIKDVLGKRFAEHFFFIRYSDTRGPHIRLRFQAEKRLLRSKLKPYLLSYFEQYPQYPLRFVAYRPEVERYGGPAGLPIGERQFEASSRAVLTLIAGSEGWSQQRALGAALQFQLGMVQALGIPKKEALDFFAHLAWHYHRDDPKKELALQENLEKQEHILPQLARIWAACEQGLKFEETWFNDWRRDMQAIGTQLQKAEHAQQLECPMRSIYESYVHMTNNRLGVPNSDEPFIGYILEKVLETYLSDKVGKSNQGPDISGVVQRKVRNT